MPSPARTSRPAGRATRHIAARREPAQIFVFFVLALAGLVALTGMVLDGGTLYVERRTAQNAADAAALAGVRLMVRATSATTLANLQTEIQRYVDNNTFGPSTRLVCAYFVQADGVSPLSAATNGSGGGLYDAGSGSGCSSMDLSGQTLTNATTAPTGCASPAGGVVPCQASGIHVDTRIGPYNTYLLGVVGFGQLTAEAHATAQIGTLASVDGDLVPLAGCGDQMIVEPNNSASAVDIVGPNQYPVPDGVNLTIPRLPSQYGLDFVLQGAKMSKDQKTPPCPASGGNSWKGKLESGTNNADDGLLQKISIPGNVPADNGNGTIDSIIQDVCVNKTRQGDPTNWKPFASNPPLSWPDPDNPKGRCRLIIPIASAPAGCGVTPGLLTSSPPCPPEDQAYLVGFACFDLYDGGNGDEKWRGVLRPGYLCPPYGSYSPGGTFSNGGNGPTKIMLTN